MSQASSLFVLDTNVFIAAHRRYYARDICPGFWDALTHYAREGRVLSIDRVRAEILRGHDNLSKWVKGAPIELFTSSAEQSVINTYSEMMNWVQVNNQFRDDAKDEYARVADGWVAAYASAHHAVVITHETFNPTIKKKVPLPNVCRQFNVRYQDTFEMLRELEIRFRWERRS